MSATARKWFFYLFSIIQQEDFTKKLNIHVNHKQEVLFQNNCRLQFHGHVASCRIDRSTMSQLQIVHYHNQPSWKMKPSQWPRAHSMPSVRFQNKEHLCQLHAIVIIVHSISRRCSRYLFTKTLFLSPTFGMGREWEKIEQRRQGHKLFNICVRLSSSYSCTAEFSWWRQFMCRLLAFSILMAFARFTIVKKN